MKSKSTIIYYYDFDLFPFPFTYALKRTDDIHASKNCQITGLSNLTNLLQTGGRSRRMPDLYCVVEVNHIHKAKTVVRSGGVNFDWDEK